MISHGIIEFSRLWLDLLHVGKRKIWLVDNFVPLDTKRTWQSKSKPYGGQKVL